MAHLGPSLRRRSSRAARPWRRAVVALAVSLLLNGLLLWRVDVSGLRPRPGAAPPREVALAPLSAQQWSANRAVSDGRSRPAPPPPPARAAPPPPERKPPEAPGQVVETAPSKDDRAPKDSRFVSERNNTVEKETRSRLPGKGGPGTPGPRGTPSPPPQPPSVAAAPPRPRPTAKSAGGQAAAEQKPAPERGKLALAPGPRADLPSSTRSPEGARSGARGETPGGERPDAAEDSLKNLNLRPSATELNRVAAGGGGGGSPDHVEGVEEGDQTFLNTREWKYAGYFNRIKQAVAEHWNPVPSLTARDPDGAKFGYKDWNTLLSVKLDASGGLKAVSVARSSGLDFLDRTAMEAFRAAQPFNNPPPGLADDRGDIAFTFGFYLQMGSPGLRLFRGPNR